MDDKDEAELAGRARAHAASLAKEGEVRQEYERLLEQQRQQKQREAEENERKLKELLASDPEFARSSLSLIHI